MRSHRIILAVLVGVGLTGLLSATAQPLVTNTVQETVASALPLSVSDAWYTVLVDTSVALTVALPGLVLAVLVCARRRRSTDNETRCRQCGYILRGLDVPRCSECGTTI